MPRPPRIVIPGLSHHVYQRGHNRSPIFRSESDYLRFLWDARDTLCAHGIDAHGFALMTNHYHFVLTPPTKESLSLAMGALVGEYTKYFNRTYERTGTLWGGRFQAKPIEDERYWLHCLRYVESNPVEAKLVAAPEHYQWTSYRVHADGEPNDWLVPHHVYLALGKTPAERQRAYKALWQSDSVPDWCT